MIDYPPVSHRKGSSSNAFERNGSLVTIFHCNCMCNVNENGITLFLSTGQLIFQYRACLPLRFLACWAGVEMHEASIQSCI